MARNNSTFVGGFPAWANACVGENGFPDYWEYAKGFSQAASTLIDLVLQRRGFRPPVDEMVYPVCFNMRHSVELRLKVAISELIHIEKSRGRELQFDLAGSHDIGIIWNFLSDKARAIDDRYETILDSVDAKIGDIAEVDATGQTFRYPLNTESRKHLVDIAVINFVVLKNSFRELEAKLDDLHRLNKYLRDEYMWGSFTKRVSRKNLFEIAAMLPPRKAWIEESFRTTKDAIKNRFSIGSKEFSECIKLIESHFELAPQIEMSIPLLGIEDNDVVKFFNFWFKQREVINAKERCDNKGIERGSEEILQKLLIGGKERTEFWKKIRSELTPERLAGVSALFYFARDLDFSESYAIIYEREIEEAEASFASGEDSVRSQYFHIFNKMNADYNILQSLYFLRKGKLADRIVAKNELEEKFCWLGEARKRTLFRKPAYCGYAL